MSQPLSRVLLPAALLAFLFVSASCSDDGDASTDGAPAVDSKLLPDLGALPDLPPKTDPCESEWKDAVTPQSKVSTGTVVTTDQGGGVFETIVDASAGGMSGAASNPFVYVSFSDGGKRVDVDDLAAKTDTTWDLALKRVVIRVNGGDSGAGQGAVAVLPGKTLSQVTAVPAASSFKTDDFIDDNCVIKRDPINNIWTAFAEPTGLWYDYDSSTMKVAPKDQAYVLQLADGKSYIKLRIEAYYYGGISGKYKLSWSTLP